MYLKPPRVSRQSLIASAFALMGLLSFSETNFAQDAPNARPPKLRVLTAIGNATVTTGNPCTAPLCPGTDVCVTTQLTGHVVSFNSFGPQLMNPTATICITEDTTESVALNGCAPAGGTLQLSGSGGNAVSFLLAGQMCALVPPPTVTTLSVINAAFDIANGAGLVRRGSGVFSAFVSTITTMNTTTSDASFTLNGNFSK